MVQEPLQIYSERLVQVGRVFELYPDRIVVHIQWLWGRPYQTTVPLASLSPDCVYQPVRNRLFKHGMLVMAIGIAAALLFVPSDRTTLAMVVQAASWTIALTGLALAAITFKQVMFARFPTRDGRRGLDIAQSGPDRERFSSFVKLVQQHIRKQRRTG